MSLSILSSIPNYLLLPVLSQNVRIVEFLVRLSVDEVEAICCESRSVKTGIYKLFQLCPHTESCQELALEDSKTFKAELV